MRFKDKGHNLFQFWFHTNFIPDDNKLILKKKELDCKAIKKNKAFTDDFAVELTFEKLGQNETEEDKSDGDVTDSILHGRKRGISMFAFQRQLGEQSPTPSMSRLDSFRSTRVNVAQRNSSAKSLKIDKVIEGEEEEERDAEEKHESIDDAKSGPEAVDETVDSSEVVIVPLDD